MTISCGSLSEDDITHTFFEALGSNGKEEAMAVFHRSSFTEGPDHVLSP